MIIALASPCIASALDKGLDKIKRLLSEASAQGAEIVCFPGSLSPRFAGDRILRYCPLVRRSRNGYSRAVAHWGANVCGGHHPRDGKGSRRAGRQKTSPLSLTPGGQIQGYQTKNQVAPTEDPFYVPGNTRRLFEINGVKFGVVICHEGWRYPETVALGGGRGGAQNRLSSPTTREVIETVSV